MTNVAIYNNDGEQISEININDNIYFVNGRVSKGDVCYYKGIGMPYIGHYLEPESITHVGYDVLEYSDVFYVGPYVSKKCFAGKTGIFKEKYQPQFSDFIGTCGLKELSIIENSMFFKRSSVKVLDTINYDKEDQQYYFVLNYSCDRISYLQRGDPKQLYELLEYCIKEHWNFIWDKASIEDVSFNGLVTDVGDIFQSAALNNKLGTVYSILYSMNKINLYKYTEFCKIYDLPTNSSMSNVFNSVELLKRFGVDISELTPHSDPIENFKYIVLNYLVNGRNCGDCCYIDLGDKIRQQYLLQTKKQLRLD